MDASCSFDDPRYSKALSGIRDALGAEGEAWIRANGKGRTIPKGAVFLRAGEAAEEILLVLRGLFKYYYIGADGDERIKHFADEGNMVLSASSFLERSPSRFFIQAIEDSEVLAFRARELRASVAPGGALDRAFQAYLVRTLLEKEEREADFLFMDGKGRYEDFMRRRPELAARVKQYEIASYLGIDPAHLSRIRAAR